jgi:hypothetical protein
VEFAFLGFTHDFGFPGFGDILNFCLKSGVHFSCLLKRFPFGVIYTRMDNGLLVLAIAHLHRKPGYLAKRLTC